MSVGMYIYMHPLYLIALLCCVIYIYTYTKADSREHLYCACMYLSFSPHYTYAVCSHIRTYV